MCGFSLSLFFNYPHAPAQTPCNQPAIAQTQHRLTAQLAQLGLHYFLRLAHALYCRSRRCLDYVAFSVLHGESSKCLAPPRNTKDRKHLQSTQSTGNRHTSQTKHQTLLKGQPRIRITTVNTAALHTSAQPAIITRTQQDHHQILSANAA